MGRLAAAAGALALVVGAAAACSGGFGPEDSDAVVVYGDVTAAGDGPVVGADVDVTAFSGNCGSSIFSSVSARTDSTGRYETSVINFQSGFRRCVEVRADPPEGSGLGPGLVRVPDVPLNDDTVVDSLRVDLALDSVPAG